MCNGLSCYTTTRITLTHTITFYLPVDKEERSYRERDRQSKSPLYNISFVTCPFASLSKSGHETASTDEPDTAFSATEPAYKAMLHTGLLSLTSLTVIVTSAELALDPLSVAVMRIVYESLNSRSSRVLVEITPVFSFTVKFRLSAPGKKHLGRKGHQI